MKISNRLRALHTYFAITQGNRMVKSNPAFHCDGLCTALVDHFGTGTMETFYWLFNPDKRQRDKLIGEGKSYTYFGSDDTHSRYGEYTELRQTMILLMAEAISDYGTYIAFVEQAIRYHKRNKRPALASQLKAYLGMVRHEAKKYGYKPKGAAMLERLFSPELQPKLFPSKAFGFKDVVVTIGGKPVKGLKTLKYSK